MASIQCLLQSSLRLKTMILPSLISAVTDNNYLKMHGAALVQNQCNWQRNQAPEIYVHSLIIKLLDLLLISDSVFKARRK